MDQISVQFMDMLHNTGFALIDWKNCVMILISFILLYLAIAKEYQPLLLVPIGFGILVGNIPFPEGHEIGVYETGSVLNFLYSGVIKGYYPPIVFLGIGAMTDFSAMIAQPRLILLGAAAQIGIFITFWMGILLPNITPKEAASIGIIGGADGPTAIFLTSHLAPHMIGTIAICAYSYMALVPIIQPPIMRMLTTKKERLIRMKTPRVVTKTERIAFPIIALITSAFIAPDALILVGMLFLGNILKESGVTERLAYTARESLINIITIFLGFMVGCSTQADVFLNTKSLMVFIMGALSFMVATAGGVLLGKLMNFLQPKNPINPLIGAAGVSAVPMAARVAHIEGTKEDPSNFLLQHAMAPNVAGVIGSAIAAGALLSMSKYF